jgi:hypothetical protein
MKFFTQIPTTEAMTVVAGVFQAPPKMVKEMSEYVAAVRLMFSAREEYAEAKKRAEAASNEATDDDLAQAYNRDIAENAGKEMEEIVRNFLQAGGRFGLSRTVFLSGRTELSREFPLDLEGWRYGGTVERELRKDPGRAKSVLDGFKTVTLYILPSHGERGGSWSNTYKGIQIYGIEHATSLTVEHELQHMAQDLLSELTGSPGAGRPPKDVATPSVKQKYKTDKEKYSKEIEDVIREFRQKGVEISPSDFHAVDDVEFYTYLNSSVEMFLRSTKVGIPLSWKELSFLVKAFVGMGVDEDDPGNTAASKYVLRNSGWPDRFFGILKEKGGNGKYEKAVNELVKAVQATRNTGGGR